MPITIIPDTGVNNIYVNADTGRNIILSGINATGENIFISGIETLAPHNQLAGLQGGQAGQYYHLTADEYANLNTGIDTSLFYSASNPSGFITLGEVPSQDLTAYATIEYVSGADNELSGRIDSLEQSTGNFVPYLGATGDLNLENFSFKGDMFEGTLFVGREGSPAPLNYGLKIGKNGGSAASPEILFVNGSTTGALVAPADLSSAQQWLLPDSGGTLARVEDLSIYVTGDVVRPSETGQFYPASNPSGFITGTNQISFSLLLPTGIEETGIQFPYELPTNPRVFTELILNSDTGYYVGVKNISTTGYTAVFSDVIGEEGIYLQTLANL